MSKNAVVTGGTRGIGKAISDELTSLGYDVLSADRSFGDLSTIGGIDKLVDTIDFDIDVFVNNAAFTKFIPHENLDELDDETFDKIFNVNVNNII